MVAYNLNDYIWASAQGIVDGTGIDAAVWNVGAYAYRPIFPINNLAAVDMSLLPVLLYDIRLEDMPGTLWPMYRECVTYTIVGSSTNIPQLFSLRNYIYELLHRRDETARDINSYLPTSDISVKHVRTYQKGNLYQFQEPSGTEHHNAVVLEAYVDYTKS